MSNNALKIISTSNEITSTEFKSEIVSVSNNLAASIHAHQKTIDTFIKTKEDYENTFILFKWFKKGELEKANLNLSVTLTELAKISLMLNAQSLSNSIEIRNIQELLLNQQNESIVFIKNLQAAQNKIDNQVKAIQNTESEINNTIIFKFNDLEEAQQRISDSVKNLNLKTKKDHEVLNGMINQLQSDSSINMKELESSLAAQLNQLKDEHHSQVTTMINDNKKNRIYFYSLATLSIASIVLSLLILVKNFFH